MWGGDDSFGKAALPVRPSSCLGTSNKMAARPCEISALCLVQNPHGQERIAAFLYVDVLNPAATMPKELPPAPASATCKSQLKHEDGTPKKKKKENQKNRYMIV